MIFKSWLHRLMKELNRFIKKIVIDSQRKMRYNIFEVITMEKTMMLNVRENR